MSYLHVEGSVGTANRLYLHVEGSVGTADTCHICMWKGLWVQLTHVIFACGRVCGYS